MNEEIKNNYTGTKISPKPKEAVDIGIDQKNTFLNNIMGTLQSTTRDLSVLESFLNVSDTRESSYQLIDIMAQDSTLSAVLETNSYSPELSIISFIWSYDFLYPEHTLQR